MNSGFRGEDYGELLEDVESDESDEAFSDEAGPRRSLSRVVTAKRGNPVPQRIPSGIASKADLVTTAQRLDARISTNSKAIATVDARTRSVVADTAKLRAMVRRDMAEQKTATEALRKGLDDQRQLTLLLPLLATTTTANIPGGLQNVVIDDGDQFSKLLPIILMSGGLGGTSSSGSGGLLGGSDGGIGTLALVLALSGNKS